MASTRVVIATLSGARRATNRKKVRSADKRMLRERTVLPRWDSRASRNRRTNGASRSVTHRAEGSMPTVSLIKVRRRRKVSRQLAIVWGLIRLWWHGCSVKKAWTWVARQACGDVIGPLLLPHSAETGPRRRPPDTNAGYAQWQRHAVRHAGWGGGLPQWARGPADHRAAQNRCAWCHR